MLKLLVFMVYILCLLFWFYILRQELCGSVWSQINSVAGDDWVSVHPESTSLMLRFQTDTRWPVVLVLEHEPGALCVLKGHSPSWALSTVDREMFRKHIFACFYLEKAENTSVNTRCTVLYCTLCRKCTITVSPYCVQEICVAWSNEQFT